MLGRMLFPPAWALYLLASSMVVVQAQEYKKTPPGIPITHYAAQTNIFVGAPSMVILPNGDYIASHDLFGKGDRKSVV